ncbi:hypothetical protein TNCV_4241991 [Trichonephila clavipes]|nr:hypothetical protein TNCV_4241991 [Trichonephila clavipes]
MLRDVMYVNTNNEKANYGEGLEISTQEVTGGDKSVKHAGQFTSPRREISHSGKAAHTTPMETLELWAVAPSCCQHTLSISLSWRAGLFPSLEIFPVARRHPSTLKHIFDQMHDLVKEYRNDDEKHVALQLPTDSWRNTPPQQKRAAASTTTCLKQRQVRKQIFYSPIIHRAPPHTPSLSTNITATCSKQEAPTPYPVSSNIYIHFY